MELQIKLIVLNINRKDLQKLNLELESNPSEFFTDFEDVVENLKKKFKTLVF